MRNIFLALVLCLTVAAPVASAQQFFSNSRIGHLDTAQTVVGTSTADAISASSVNANLLSWKICNNAVNTSTYLYVGKAADAATDGVQLNKGQCLVCDNCVAATLKLMKVKAQAASNGYSVIMYRQ